MKRVAIHSLGCKVNSYEAESMEQLLVNAGYTIVPFDENVIADVYIINTCSVTNIADRKSRQMLHKAKKMNPDAIVVAAGCYVNAQKEDAGKDSAVDIILGNNCKINIVEALEQYYNDKNMNSIIQDMSIVQPYEKLEIDNVCEHTRAYIKIQDGCNQFCSYCIIPYTRGRIRSREMQDILEEVNRLVKKGYKEFVLTGIHLSSYGMDNNKGSLLEVIENIHNIDGVERIRLGSLEPRVVTDEFVKRISSLEKVCPHFHLSLQSGCDEILKKMNRKYNTEQYYKGCEILRKYYDNPAITTDVIVGFPGESEENFVTTQQFLQKVNFYEMHIFKYSRRKGTVADKMPDQIDGKIKTVRSNKLMKLEKEMSSEYRNIHVGKVMDVLLEQECEYMGRRYYTGYTKNYIKVYVDAKKMDSDMTNQIVNVHMEALSDNREWVWATII